MAAPDETILIALPRSHWDEIVRLVEKVCYLPAGSIEILASAQEVATVTFTERIRRAIEEDQPEGN